jgi:hypothetical protein
MVQTLGLDLPANHVARLDLTDGYLFVLRAGFLAVDRHSHSVSDTLYGIFPFFVPAFGILGWIASHTSSKA